MPVSSACLAPTIASTLRKGSTNGFSGNSAARLTPFSSSSRVNAVRAAHVVALAQDGLRLVHRLPHGAVDVGERKAVGLGQLLRELAQLGQVLVVDLGLLAAALEELRVDDAGAADDDRSAGL